MQGQGLIQDFFAREGKWDAQTMYLPSFAISARMCTYHHKKVLFRIGEGETSAINQSLTDPWCGHPTNRLH